MSAQHTPTPWSVDRGLVIRDAEGKWVANVDGGNDAVSKTRAAFIVRACNAHDDLVEALCVIRMSAGWQLMAKETRHLVDTALAKAGAA